MSNLIRKNKSKVSSSVAEITPVKWRGRALALVLCTTIPFIPYLIYVQELQQHATWRWGFMIPASVSVRPAQRIMG